ncbi:MAG: hypothetical protein KY468_11375 [Armatimonadetes bacterium]|nr:hypothetical protein [Armatimonadota bacterium]
MTLPLKLLNRLRLGRDVAARVQARLENHSAWIYVYPLLNPEKGKRVKEPGREARIVSDRGESAIRGFLLRYLEVETKIVEDYLKGTLDEADYPSVEEFYEVSMEEELAEILTRWIDDFSLLHEPSIVGYVFDRGSAFRKD